MDGFNRTHAVLGTSDACIATYPGDFAQALIALDATVEMASKSGVRSMSFAQLHKPPGESPGIETTLQPGELISGFAVNGRWPRSIYLKVRDRQSYEFASSRTVWCVRRVWLWGALPRFRGGRGRLRRF
jgi:xanthine dehydrogenase YagS FAD-binding subunit